MQGPFAIVFRGHSGSRLLSEAFLQNDFWMGRCDNKTRDAEEFAYYLKPVRKLVKHAFDYPTMALAERGLVQQKMRDLVESSKASCPAPQNRMAFGWKRAIGAFLIEIFLDAYPAGKAIHLIRDGRDVMLSRLRRVEEMDDPTVRQMVFGEAELTHYRGAALRDEALRLYRNEIEMLHWVTSVRFGMRGRKYPKQYLEVLYEDLCREPKATLTRVFDFLEVPLYPQTLAWIAQNASRQRIGKWQSEAAQLEAAIKIGEPLLQELGYLGSNA